MKKFVELKTVEKGDILINVNHIVSVETVDDSMSKILLSIGHPVSCYTVQENVENIKRKIWEFIL